MFRFVAFTLIQVALLALAIAAQGVFAWVALAGMTLSVALLDRLIPANMENAPPGAEFPMAPRLLVVLGLAHLALLAGAVTSLASHPLTPDMIALFIAMSLFAGQISHPCAHELIHQGGRRDQRLGVAIYCSMLFGHHASAHMRVHHIHAATDQDPNSARIGTGFWRFALRAWLGSYRAAYIAEAKMGRTGLRHPYVGQTLATILFLVTAYLLGGRDGLGWMIAIAVYAQLQVLLADYVQHYGLRRRKRADGRMEPVGPAHSWNAPHVASSAMMLNAPRHSDHHTNPTRDFPALRLNADTMPVLPYALPIMAVIALWPPLWRQIMNPLARKWADTDTGADGPPVTPAPLLAD